MSDLNGGRQYIGSRPRSREIPLAADTYHLGMRLEYNGTNKNHEILSSGTLSAIYNGTDGRVLAGVGSDNAIVGGGIVESGLVDAAGDPLGSPLTEDEKTAYQAAGFYVEQY
jgi:hypothetical protein